MSQFGIPVLGSLGIGVLVVALLAVGVAVIVRSRLVA